MLIIVIHIVSFCCHPGPKLRNLKSRTEKIRKFKHVAKALSWCKNKRLHVQRRVRGGRKCRALQGVRDSHALGRAREVGTDSDTVSSFRTRDNVHPVAAAVGRGTCPNSAIVLRSMTMVQYKKIIIAWNFWPFEPGQTNNDFVHVHRDKARDDLRGWTDWFKYYSASSIMILPEHLVIHTL